MRHLRRHYFDNYISADAKDQFVAMIDQGRSSANVPRYSVVVGTMSTLAEVLNAANFLLAAPCFFKLPIGATAIVDIYIPDTDDSDDPKTFDYRVFKAKETVQVPGPSANKLGKVYDELSQLMRKEEAGASKSVDSGGPNAAKGPLGPTGNTGGTSGIGATGGTGGAGATVSVCHLASSGPSGPSNPCDGQSGIYCEDPINTFPECVNGALQCISLEPGGKKPKRGEGKK